MGKVDILSQEYLEQDEVYTDAVNLVNYEGKPVIKPEMLREMNSVENHVIIPKSIRKRTKLFFIRKYCDIIKRVYWDGSQMRTYAIIGIEEQTHIHYAIPIKIMLYDSLTYEKQLKKIAVMHRRKKDLKTSHEYLSGMAKDDKLSPVQTFVVFLSSEAWEGPMSLHDILDMEGMTEEEKALFPDFPVRIIEPVKIPDEQLALLTSDLKLLLGFIKYSKDKNTLKNYMDKIVEFKHMIPETVELLNEVCHTNIKLTDENGKKKEAIDMCIAFEQMKEEGIQQGEIRGKVLAYNDMNLSISEIAEKCNLTEEEVKDILEK